MGIGNVSNLYFCHPDGEQGNVLKFTQLAEPERGLPDIECLTIVWQRRTLETPQGKCTIEKGQTLLWQDEKATNDEMVRATVTNITDGCVHMHFHQDGQDHYILTYPESEHESPFLNNDLYL